MVPIVPHFAFECLENLKNNFVKFGSCPVPPLRLPLFHFGCAPSPKFVCVAVSLQQSHLRISLPRKLAVKPHRRCCSALVAPPRQTSLKQVVSIRAFKLYTALTLSGPAARNHPSLTSRSSPFRHYHHHSFLLPPSDYLAPYSASQSGEQLPPSSSIYRLSQEHATHHTTAVRFWVARINSKRTI